MPRPAGIKDVAARAGVSVGTVSNVINRPSLVRPETRTRVEAAMVDVGFVRNESARQLRSGSSRIVAYVFPDVANPFFTAVAEGAQAACRAEGLALVMCSSAGDIAWERDHLALLLEKRVRGILLTTVDPERARLPNLPRLGVPVVLVDRGANALGEARAVDVDNRKGGRLAVAHLIGCGRQRIAFVGGPLSLPQLRDRLAGGRLAFERAGRPSEQLRVLQTPASTVEEGRSAAARLAALPRSERPDAVFCANDLLALGLLQELRHRGIDVPDELAVVGYDDIDFAGTAAVPLTSVRQPSALLGRTAIRLLLHGEPGLRNEHVTFPPELVVRESSGGPHLQGAGLEPAVKFERDAFGYTEDPFEPLRQPARSPSS